MLQPVYVNMNDLASMAKVAAHGCYDNADEDVDQVDKDEETTPTDELGPHGSQVVYYGFHIFYVVMRSTIGSVVTRKQIGFFGRIIVYFIRELHVYLSLSFCFVKHCVHFYRVKINHTIYDKISVIAEELTSKQLSCHLDFIL